MKFKVKISKLGTPKNSAGNPFTYLVHSAVTVLDAFWYPLLMSMELASPRAPLGSAVLRFEPGGELDSELGGRLSIFLVGAFIYVLVGDFTESNEKLLEIW